MGKLILVVDADGNLASAVRKELGGRGFSVEETTDGKGAPELIRQKHPQLVLLAVELPAGQNGYIICGKLKKDDDLKAVPVFIVGNPDGFAAHKKLKTRADEYIPKPVDMVFVKERVGALIGIPEEEGVSLNDLADEPIADEIAVDDQSAAGDADLDMLDTAFDGISTEGAADEPISAPEEESVEAPPEFGTTGETDLSGLEGVGSSADSALDALGGLEEEPRTVVAPFPTQPPPKAAPPATVRFTPAPSLSSAAPAPAPSAASSAELRSLREKVETLQSALNDAESKVSSLESELSGKGAELEAARQTGGKSDKEFFTLKEANNKKDKEILRLKQEITEKEQELVELKDKEMELERKSSDSSGELAKKDALIKTLTAKADLASADKKKVEQQLLSVKDEARAARAERDDLSARVSALETDAARVTELKEKADKAQRDADSARKQLADLQRASADEAAQLRGRLSDLEKANTSHEDRVTKFYAKIKGDEKVREKTKKALSIAMQLLEEQAMEAEDPPADA